MEAHRSIGGTLRRKPLGDCTNTLPRPSQQSSSSSATVVKFANPSLTSSLKRLVDQTTIKEKAKDANISEAGSVSASRSLATCLRPVTRRMSVDMGVLASAPSRSQNSRTDQGVGDKEIAEPYSVYRVRKKASGNKRNKDAAPSDAVASLRMDLVSSSRKKTRQAHENKPKPLKATPKKRQRRVKQKENDSVHTTPQDYINQQRAYFAEVDAFELPEEEVTSSSDLD